MVRRVPREPSRPGKPGVMRLRLLGEGHGWYPSRPGRFRASTRARMQPVLAANPAFGTRPDPTWHGMQPLLAAGPAFGTTRRPTWRGMQPLLAADPAFGTSPDPTWHGMQPLLAACPAFGTSPDPAWHGMQPLPPIREPHEDETGFSFCRQETGAYISAAWRPSRSLFIW